MIHRIVRTHPFGQGLEDKIDTVTIERSANGPSIQFDKESCAATLFLGEDFHALANCEYILYHEFSHVVDRTNHSFGYSDEKRDCLNDYQQLCVMELWNEYIDARLNRHHLFQLGWNDEGIYCRINGKLKEAPFTIEGKLLRHISFLRSRGMKDAEKVVRSLWQESEAPRSYDDLIGLAVTSTG